MYVLCECNVLRVVLAWSFLADSQRYSHNLMFERVWPWFLNVSVRVLASLDAVLCIVLFLQICRVLWETPCRHKLNLVDFKRTISF